ncbi:unnamed protein product [Microthlaspi erraticum]|uniref:F-box domain-containing protein n=1 Tax=Microthlaspi erraticum TaxID=1685480 RepID=A0A6D2JNI9_9BRAS|nr:unnamed protein product [Microthlaspi erraticum]
MSELPGDLVEEILCRVPATSLKRLRSTCKRWDRLFNDIKFTRKHFDIAPKQFMFILFNNNRFFSLSIKLQKLSPPRKVTDDLSLTDLHSTLDKMQIRRVFHCDGLLLCVTYEFNARLVVWNPCYGQTRWINGYDIYTTYALGSYQDKKSSKDTSYKILSHRVYGDNQEFKVHEIDSDSSWRTLDLVLDFELPYLHKGVSLKGKTYWIARDEKELGSFLISFDYTTEIFERLCLPRQLPSYRNLSLSIIREEKIAVLLQHFGADN